MSVSPLTRYREILADLCRENPEFVEKAFAKPTLSGWFVGQIIHRAGGGTGHIEWLNEFVTGELARLEKETDSVRTVKFQCSASAFLQDLESLPTTLLPSGLNVYHSTGFAKANMEKLAVAHAELFVSEAFGETVPPFEVLVCTTSYNGVSLSLYGSVRFKTKADAMLFKLAHGGEV